jgi:hypothetical protein
MLILILAISIIALGCSTIPIIEPQTVSGTFSGVTSEGGPVVLTLEQEGQAFKGQGTLNGQPIVIAGPLTWSAIGSLTHADGSLSLVKLSLSADSDMLTLENPEQPSLLLNRGGTPISQPTGPFTGKYQAVEGETVWAAVTLVQSGLLISGFGTVLGEMTGISGRTTAANEVNGIMLFLDESQVRFEAKLSADGQSITLLGLGAPVVLRRE